MSNIYNKFRSVEQLANKFSLSKRFDEPTYFSFRLVFATNSDDIYNIASNKSAYDVMPHPLFDLGITAATPTGINNFAPNVIREPESYSAIQYLINANEPTRAAMLIEFIEKFNDLQKNFPYYFQQIDGISELLKIDTTKGQRILADKKISITCLEGIDLRMSYLMNLYKQIAWDNTYQRWVLPDMMRYFTLKIYLAEFRTMHIPTFKESGKVYGYGTNAIEETKSSIVNTTDLRGSARKIQESMSSKTYMGTSEIPVYLKILDDILPTCEITCEMCEFDLSDITYDHLTNLKVSGETTQAAVKFGIKVGNIKELQIYPVFQHKFLSDRKLNAANRAKDQISTKEDNENIHSYPASLQIAQNRQSDEAYHLSGKPYNERTNEVNLGDSQAAMEKAANKPYVPLSVKESDNVQESIAGSTFDVNFNATLPNTWVGNAMSFGVNYAKSWLNKAIDKAKVTPIPNLGVSYTEVTTALATKNIIGALGMIRKGINTVTQAYDNAPSSKLSEPIVTDVIMREFLTHLSKVHHSKLSKATDPDESQVLIEAANTVLNDKGLWEKIKDYSLATDLIGPGEVNIENKIQNTGQINPPVTNTQATIEYGQVYESAPSSMLGQKIDLQQGLVQPTISMATNNKLQQ